MALVAVVATARTAATPLRVGSWVVNPVIKHAFYEVNGPSDHLDTFSLTAASTRSFSATVGFQFGRNRLPQY